MKRYAIGLMFCAFVSSAHAMSPGAPYLEIWPDARSTALGGAMTGLADDGYAAYWNPGGLGFQRGIGIAATGANWLPGLWPGMFLGYEAASYCFTNFPAKGLNLVTGVNWNYLDLGKAMTLDEEGESIGVSEATDHAVGIHAGVADERIGLGVNLKYVTADGYVWSIGPLLQGFHPGRALAIDLGGLLKLTRSVSLGASVDNIGTDLVYDGSSGEHASLPLMVHLGIAGSPLDTKSYRIRLLADVSQILLYGGDADSFSHDLHDELRDAWKSLGVEATCKRLFSRFSLSGRVGYFEDVSGVRGGFVFGRDSSARRSLSIIDVFSKSKRHQAGDSLRSIGLCYGIGLGYKDYVRLDVSDDHLIYDFPTSNTKFSLTVRDLLGLISDLKAKR